MSLDTDIEHRLEDIEEKIDQNSKVLRSIKRKQTFDFWIGIIKIFIFIGAFYYVYRFTEPFLIQIKEAYVTFQGLNGKIDSFNGFDFFKQSSSQ